MVEVMVGKVTHYFSKIGVAVLNLEAPLRTGDRIRIRGNTTDLQQTLDSMETGHSPIDSAQSGDDVAIRVGDRVRVGDTVYHELNGETA